MNNTGIAGREWLSEARPSRRDQARPTIYKIKANKVQFSGVLIVFLLSGLLARAETLATGWVPSSLLRQGQISLHADGTRTELEVLLNSRFMDRVVNRIISKEQANWPQQHPDATAYLQHMHEARKQIQEHDGVEVLQIVFALAPAPGLITWRTGSVREDEEDRWHLQSPVELARTEPSREYMVRNAALILADSLGLDARTTRELLASRLDDADLQFLLEVLDD